MATGITLKPRNIAILLCCVGPLIVFASGAIAEWFAHSPTPNDPTEATAEYYEKAAVFCVTGVMGGSLIFFAGLCMSSYLVGNPKSGRLYNSRRDFSTVNLWNYCESAV
jgi:hypothetical protein